MKQRIIFIHGNQTEHWSFAWAGWLKAQLDALGYETFFETMPDSILARKEYWLPFLQDHIKAGKNDVIVGWSSGAVAVMRYAETHALKGSVLVAPCYTDLGDPEEATGGYYDDPWDWAAIKANQQHITLIHGDSDPYIPQNEFEFIAKQLQPDIIKLHDDGHFIGKTEFPELLDCITRQYSADIQ
jgi:predicted alpha/beta hydrolase family esterase